MSKRAMQVRIWCGEHVVVSSYSGVLCADGVRKDRELIGSDRRFDPDLARLIDARGIEEIALSSREIQMMGQQAAFTAAAPRAFLVDSDSVYGMARAWTAWHEHSRPNTRVFRDELQAIDWLGLPPDYLRYLAEPDHDVSIEAPLPEDKR